MPTLKRSLIDWSTVISVWEISCCGEILNTNPVAVIIDPISSMSATWEIQIWFRYIIHITSKQEYQVCSIPYQRTQMEPLNWIYTPTSIVPLVRVKLNFTFQLISPQILCNAKATIARFSTKTKKEQDLQWFHHVVNICPVNYSKILITFSCCLNGKYITESN